MLLHIPGLFSREEVQRIRQASGSFVLAPDSVLLLRQALFRTDISLPANWVEGPYKVRIFLTRGGAVTDMQESQIDVQKAGVERTLYRLAMEQPLIYGVLSLLMAMVAGWAGGLGVEQMGYAAFFFLTFWLSFPAYGLLPAVRRMLDRADAR